MIAQGVVKMEQKVFYSDSRKPKPVDKKDDAEYARRLKQLQEYRGEK